MSSAAARGLAGAPPRRAARRGGRAAPRLCRRGFDARVAAAAAAAVPAVPTAPAGAPRRCAPAAARAARARGDHGPRPGGCGRGRQWPRGVTAPPSAPVRMGAPAGRRPARSVGGAGAGGRERWVSVSFYLVQYVHWVFSSPISRCAPPAARPQAARTPARGAWPLPPPPPPPLPPPPCPEAPLAVAGAALRPPPAVTSVASPPPPPPPPATAASVTAPSASKAATAPTGGW